MKDLREFAPLVDDFPHWVSPCGRVLIINGDCLHVIPRLYFIDAVIVDPVWPNVPSGLIPGWHDPFGLFRAAMQALTTTAMQRLIVMLGFDSDPRFLCSIPDSLPFLRSMAMPYAIPSYRGRLLGGDEMAYCFGNIPKGRGVIPGRLSTVTSYKADRATGHPCPRADQHLADLAKWWTTQDEVVADPFCGTGSTLIGAVKHGRKCIGIEIDPTYYAIACQRVQDALGMEVKGKDGLTQKRMFTPETCQ